MKTLKDFIDEDVPVNNVSGGNIAGIGNPNESKPANWGEPAKKKKSLMFRRKKNYESK
jgi:hypothetical protein